MERLFVYKSESIIHMETNMTAKNSVVTITSPPALQMISVIIIAVKHITGIYFFISTTQRT